MVGVAQRGRAGGDIRPVRVGVWRRWRPRVWGLGWRSEIWVLAGWVGRVAGGGSLWAGGGVTVLGRRRGVFIHGALHRWIGGQLPRLALDPTVASVADSVGVLQGVGEPMRHAHLFRHLVHHTLGAVQVAWALLGVSLILSLGLCDLDLPWLRLLQHGLAPSRRHHLERDDGRELLSAHGDVHGGQHRALAVVLAHARVRAPHLVRYEVKHVAAVAMLGHAHPALLLPQHVADGGQHRSGGGAAQEGRGVCCCGDSAGHIACVRVRRLQGVNRWHGDRALRKSSCCLHAIRAPSSCTSSISSSHSSNHARRLSSSRLLSSLRFHVFKLFSSPANTSHLCSTSATPALLPLWPGAHADEACSVGPTHNRVSSTHVVGPVVWTVNQVVLVQQAHYVMMHTLLSRVTGQSIQVIGDVTVGVVVEENLSCLEAAFSGCEEQWRLLLKDTQKMS